MGEFRMPSLGADMEVGTIVEWRVKPGDTVHRGDIVAVVDTEKSTIDVEIFEDGVIEALVVEPGVEVPVGTVLARVAAPGALVAVAAPSVASERAAAVPDTRSFVRASPRARKAAADAGIDLHTVSGRGPGGAVVIGDLNGGSAPAASPPLEVSQEEPAPAAEHPAPRVRDASERQAAMRRAIGASMARSKREIPHYYLATTVDMSNALTWLAAVNDRRPVTERLLPAVLLLKATALAAKDVPAMNGFWDGEFRPSPAVHLGVAVSLRGGGLVAPAIHDAESLGLDALMEALRDLVARARAGGLRSSEMSDPTITVTNLGDQGVEEVFGVIYPPQVAIVGFGRVIERPWARGSMVGVRPVVRATLSGDHRVSDGHAGARFLAAIDRLLQSPEGL